MENNYTIKYTKIRHGYARLDKEGRLTISIPTFLRNDKSFHENLIAKGQKLIARYIKKPHLATITEDKILIFGESTNKSDLGNDPKEINLELKKILYEYSKSVLDKISEDIGKKYTELKIKKLKSKWGSCNSHQEIVLNQDLVHLSNKLIKYVIVHEACHLKHKHHQKSFRDLVEKHCPNYKLLRKELRNLILNSKS